MRNVQDVYKRQSKGEWRQNHRCGSYACRARRQNLPRQMCIRDSIHLFVESVYILLPAIVKESLAEVDGKVLAVVASHAYLSLNLLLGGLEPVSYTHLAMAVFPPLAAHLKGVTFRYTDNQVHEEMCIRDRIKPTCC